MKKSLVITTMGLTIALNVILSHFLAFQPAPFVRIGIAFIAVAMGSILCGPVIGGAAAAIADVLGFFLFPAGGYIPGITVCAFLSGLAFGLLMYKKRPSVFRTLIAVAIVCIFNEGILNSLWLFLAIPGYTFWAIFLPRMIVNLIMLPIETFLVYLLWKVSSRIGIFGSIYSGLYTK
jgi:ECF transporter S component (folate family)